jgi:hypothetical protein
MLYAVLFEDNEDQAAMRTKHMTDHLAFLERHGAQITAAGPLKDAKDGAPAGGLWLVEAEDANAVRALIKADPFWPTGLRKSLRLLTWTQVFAQGKRLI